MRPPGPMPMIGYDRQPSPGIRHDASADRPAHRCRRTLGCGPLRQRLPGGSRRRRDQDREPRTRRRRLPRRRPYFLGEDDSQVFQAFNRNKRSLTLDLKRPEGQTVLHRLAATADAFMHNLRGDQAEKLGLTYAHLSPFNPKIVCAHISAYGRGRGAQRLAWFRLPDAGGGGVSDADRGAGGPAHALRPVHDRLHDRRNHLDRHSGWYSGRARERQWARHRRGALRRGDVPAQLSRRLVPERSVS